MSTKMNKYLALIKKRAQRTFLRARIVAMRPDLIGKPFIVQVRTFAHEAIEGYIQLRPTLADPNPDSFLPDLLYEAMEVEADRSAGYYRAQAELYKQLYDEACYQQSMASSEHAEDLVELIGTRRVLQDAIGQLNAVKFSNNRNN